MSIRRVSPRAHPLFGSVPGGEHLNWNRGGSDFPQKEDSYLLSVIPTPMTLESDAVEMVARLMALSARTAPKARA